MIQELWWNSVSFIVECHNINGSLKGKINSQWSYTVRIECKFKVRHRRFTVLKTADMGIAEAMAPSTSRPVY